MKTDGRRYLLEVGGEKYFRIHAALNAVLDDHLGPDPGKPIFGPSNVMFSLILPSGVMSPAMSRKQELEKLNRINRAAREFASAWSGLHSALKREIRGSGDAFFDGGGESYNALKEHGSGLFWYALDDLGRIMGAGVPKARALIDTAPEVGKSDMQSIDIIGALRRTWEHRKGRPAPKNVAEGGAFYRFVDAAFTAMELKRDVRSAMDAWRKFTDKHPDGVRGVRQRRRSG